MKLFKNFVKLHRVELLTWLSGLMFLLQLLNLHSYVIRTAEHQAVIAATDDDGAWNVAKTLKTRWWKDNGWVLYGPAYFRLNHTIQYFWGRTAEPTPMTDHETWERTAHTAVMTTSLLAVGGVALLIAGSLVPLWWMRFLVALALTSAFLGNAKWAELVLRAHPDHLFTLVILGALWCLVRMFERPLEPLWRMWSAILFGISVSVKMTLSVCAPGFFLLFVPPFSRARFRSGLRYLGLMLLAYFLIGFPQTIVLDRPFRELRVINGLSAPVTLASMQHWLATFADQLAAPVAVLLLAWLCFARRNLRLTREAWIRLGLFALVPLLVLLGKNMMVPADHYVMPFAGLQLLFLGFALSALPWLSLHKWELTRATFFTAVTLMVWGTTPKAMQTALDKSLVCRGEARETYARLLALYDRGENIWVDPYVPYKTDAEPSRVELSWEKTWSGYARGHWTVLALNRDFRRKFTDGAEPSLYVQTDIPGWRPVREFYQAFALSDVATTPDGVRFRRIFANDCGQEIWQREAATPAASH